MPFAALAVSALAAWLTVAVPDDADEQARYIDGLHARQLHDLLIEEAAGFLDEHPGHDRADQVRYRLANALFDLGRQADARPHFARLAARRGFAQGAESALRLGQCALEAGDHADAATAFRQVLESDTDYLHTPATFLLGDALFRDGRYAESEPLFEAARRADPAGPYARDAVLSLVWCAFRTGDMAATVTRAESALRGGAEAAERRELSFLRGEALLALERPAEALAALAVVDAGPYRPAALRSTAFAHGALGDHAAAARDFGRLLEAAPDGEFAGEAAFQLGVHRLQTGDADGAWAALSDRRVPDSAEAAYWRARARGDQGRTDEALALLERAARMGPSSELAAHIQAARGDLLVADGRGAEAAAAYEAGGSPAALHAAAVTRLNAGDAAGALELVERLLGDGLADPAMQRTRGEALFVLERWAEAEAALSAAPDDARRASRLAWCRYQQGDLSEAARRFEQLAGSDGDATLAAEAAYMAGRCHDELGDGAAARRQWERYLQRHGDGAHAVDVLLGLSRHTTGRARAEHLVAVIQRAAGGPQAAHALLALADDLAAAGEHGQAAQLYQRLIEEHGDHETAWLARYGLAWARLELDDPAGAVTALERLVARPDPRRRDPVPPADLALAARELLVWCHHEAGRPDRAEQALAALAAHDAPAESLLEAARTVAAAWVTAGQPARALSGLESLADQPALAAPLRVEATWIALDAGDLSRAVELARRAVAAAPDGRDAAEAAFFVAEACFEAGDDGAALPLYRAAADAAASPVAPDALYKAGFTHLRNDAPSEALPCFARLADEHPTSPLLGEALFLAGEACFRQDDFEAAVPWLTRVLDEQPRHAVAAKARFRLGLSLSQLDRWSAAADVLADLARRHPDFENLTEAELWRGRALAAQGQDRPARAAFGRVVADDRGVLAARARLGLGQLSMTAGRLDEALSEFLKVAVLYAHDDEVAQALLLAGDCLAAQGQAEAAAARWQEVIAEHGATAYAGEARHRLQSL